MRHEGHLEVRLLSLNLLENRLLREQSNQKEVMWTIDILCPSVSVEIVTRSTPTRSSWSRSDRRVAESRARQRLTVGRPVHPLPPCRRVGNLGVGDLRWHRRCCDLFELSKMIEPNATLYVKNIDWKVKKPLLKRALYALFSRHGKVLEVIVLRRDGLRGQAWVIMEDVQAATAALQAENGFTFFEKDLVIEYAREKSDRIARLDKTYVPKAKRRKVAKDGADAEHTEADDKGDGRTEEDGDASEPTQQPKAPQEPPSKYLLAQNLPEACNEMMLGMLFRQYTGFKEVRMPRQGLAFIEFEDEPHATLALKGLNGFKLSQTEALELTYGKA